MRSRGVDVIAPRRPPRRQPAALEGFDDRIRDGLPQFALALHDAGSLSFENEEAKRQRNWCRHGGEHGRVWCDATALRRPRRERFRDQDRRCGGELIGLRCSNQVPDVTACRCQRTIKPIVRSVMTSTSLHPLARQALWVAATPPRYGWAFGMAKYLAHDDPTACIRWTLSFIAPYFNQSNEQEGIVTRSIEVLDQVLTDPASANVKQLEEFVWTPWSHRSITRGGGPLARLIWAAIEVVKMSAPRQEPPSRNASSGDNVDMRSDLIWEQTATAIQTLAYNSPEIPQEMAKSFTSTACFLERPPNCGRLRRFEWEWCNLKYEIAILRALGSLFVEFTDLAGVEPLYSGPFSTMREVEECLKLLKHQPKTIHLVPVQ